MVYHISWVYMNTFFCISIWKSTKHHKHMYIYIYIYDMYAYIFCIYIYIYTYIHYMFFGVHAIAKFSNSAEVKRFASTMPTPAAPLMSTMLTPLPQGTGRDRLGGRSSGGTCGKRWICFFKWIKTVFLILWIRNDLCVGELLICFFVDVPLL